MFAMNHSTRAIGNELHHTVERDREQRVVEQQHDGEQGNASRHADDGREDRSRKADQRKRRELRVRQAYREE
jgi:hypothetical protein